MMACVCLKKEHIDLLVSVLPAIATFAGIWFACKAARRAARIDQKIAVAPQRLMIYSLYSLLIGCLEKAVQKFDRGKPLTEADIRRIIDEWMFEIEIDGRMKVLIRTGKIEPFSSGHARGNYRAVKESIMLMLSESVFYYPENDIRAGLRHLAEFFGSIEECTTDYSSDSLDGNSQSKINTEEVEMRIRKLVEESVKVVKRMETELAVE